jgi:hypothetical protein
MKKLVFLSGFQRSGSTLLSSLLNQHPDVFVSNQSPMIEMTYILQEAFYVDETVLSEYRIAQYLNVIRNVPKSYYHDINKPIVVDKNRGWGTTYNLEIARFLTRDNVKILFPYRPVLEILASWITLCNKYPDTNIIDSDMKNDKSFLPQYYLPLDDARCEYIMKSNGVMSKSFFAFEQAKLPENKSIFHLIKYDDIVNDTLNVLKNIETYFEISHHKYNLDSVNINEKYNDERAWGIPTLHEVRPVIKKTSKKPEDVLSTYICEKYKNLPLVSE